MPSKLGDAQEACWTIVGRRRGLQEVGLVRLVDVRKQREGCHHEERWTSGQEAENGGSMAWWWREAGWAILGDLGGFRQWFVGWDGSRGG